METSLVIQGGFFQHLIPTFLPSMYLNIFMKYNRQIKLFFPDSSSKGIYPQDKKYMANGKCSYISVGFYRFFFSDVDIYVDRHPRYCVETSKYTYLEKIHFSNSLLSEIKCGDYSLPWNQTRRYPKPRAWFPLSYNTGHFTKHCSKCFINIISFVKQLHQVVFISPIF